FDVSSDWLERLQADFPYRETPDQAQAIEAVFEDLEAPRPMDRLVCGDVGFGKTEVAVRAAFAVAVNGKQTLVLVPTVILAEEQRFGVAQKELLRSLRLEVDVLALSATPIPRTLHMSLAGLRDISVIETPPEGRRAIRTTVDEYDEELVKLALEREHAR